MQKLNHTIIIQSPADTPDGIGGITEGWQDFVTCRARAAHVKRQSLQLKRFANSQLAALSFMSFTIRYMEGISADMRIIYNGQTFTILDIDNIGQKNRILEIFTRSDN